VLLVNVFVLCARDRTTGQPVTNPDVEMRPMIARISGLWTSAIDEVRKFEARDDTYALFGRLALPYFSKQSVRMRSKDWRCSKCRTQAVSL
jgi:hypothetical protein